jgi:hypothetical protein
MHVKWKRKKRRLRDLEDENRKASATMQAKANR